MKIKNTSKLPIECFDGDRFTKILPGESADIATAVVRRMKLVERGLVVSEEPAKPAAVVPPTPVPPPAAPAYRAPARAKLQDEADA